MKTYDELLAERDALDAQVEMLRNAWESVKATDWTKQLDEAFNATPQQCLAEIKAEAIEGFFAHFESESYWDKTVNDVIDEGYEYAAEVRQGGAE